MPITSPDSEKLAGGWSTGPPPDRLVDIGGYRLHLLCVGKGSPAVVVIPALAGSAFGWLNIQRLLAAQTTVCL